MGEAGVRFGLCAAQVPLHGGLRKPVGTCIAIKAAQVMDVGNEMLYAPLDAQGME
jgi:hypothetical protein